MLFFFDTDDGHREIEDGVGVELSGEAEAVQQAVALLRDLSHAGADLGAPRTFSVRVRDAGGEAAYAASLRLEIRRA